jgi:MYXO-CTERM domain-containing protein
MLIDSGIVTDISGLGLLAVGLLFQWRKQRSLAAAGLPTAAN